MRRLLLTLGAILLLGTVLPAQLNVSQPSPVNVSQINGVTPLMGAGNTGTGSPRVTLATDQAALAGLGAGATGSAVPANAILQGGKASGNTTAAIYCDNIATYDAATNGSTQLAALTSGQIIYVCGYAISQSTTTAVTVNLRYGTGTNCATSPSNITPAYPLQAPASAGPIGIVVMGPAGSPVAKTIASNALCINTNAAVSVQAQVLWTKF